MRELWRKEVKLTASPLTWIFIAFSVMTMIPNYPILVGSFFVCLGIFYTFQFSREYNDIQYTALLPVKKSDVVKTKYLFTVGIQMIAFVADLLFATLRMTVLSGVAAYRDTALMNANLAYLGYVLIVFALFNLIFLGGFFKTAYYIGKPFLIFSVAAFLTVLAAETLHHIPGLGWLGAMEGSGLGLQAALLACGVICYGVGTYTSFAGSVKKFDVIDL